MAQSSRYARVSDDEGERTGMITSETSTRALEWSNDGGKSENIAWWKYAAAAGVFIALLIPAVGYTSSVMLENRVAKAIQQAPTTQPTHTSTPIISGGSKDALAESAASEGIPLTLSNGTTIIAGNPMGGKTFEIHDCGSNADEARAKGCAYDVMMQEWTPPECIDWTLSERFLKNGNWTWYADSAAASTYDNVQVAKGDHSVVYVAQSYHRHHCIFTWERMVRAMRTQRPMVEKLVDYDHVMHCRMNTLKTFEEGAKAVRGVVAPTAFTRCASLDVWMKNLPHNKMSSIERMLKERAWEEIDFEVEV